MKKTEKIEVRVSHEEKARLSGIADARGLSVSELIRESVAEDIGTLPRIPRWPGYAAVAAGALAVAALGVSLMTSSPTPADTRAVYPSSISVQANWASDTDVIFSLPVEGPAQHDWTMRSKAGEELRVTVTTAETKDRVMPITITACVVQDAACIPFETPDVALNTRPSQGSRAAASANVPGSKDALHLSFYTQTHWPVPEPKSS